MKKLLIALLFVFWASTGWAATYYVSQAGAGAKDGSLAAPSEIATFNAANCSV